MSSPLEREVRRSLKPRFLVHGAPMDKVLPNLDVGLRIGREIDPASLSPDYVCFAVLQKLGDPVRSLRRAQIYTSQNGGFGDRLMAIIIDPRMIGPEVDLQAVGTDFIDIRSSPEGIRKSYGYNSTKNTIFDIPITAKPQTYVHPDEVRAKPRPGSKGPLIVPSTIKAVVIEMQDAYYLSESLSQLPKLHNFEWPVIAFDGRLISPNLNPRNFLISSEG